jgi:UDPglucose 6-dehydrogenase
VDINAPDFVDSFDKSKALVGIIGQGFVGSAMKAYFDRHEVPVVAYDKFKPEFSTLEEVVKKADVIFVCVPTPMRQSGECYTGIPEDVFADIDRTAKEIGRPTDSFVCCLKSTVPAGFTDGLRKKYPHMRITFSPEFLTEKNSVQDMIQANRIIVGGATEDSAVVLQFFLAADQRRVDEGKVVLIQCPAAAAEMAKLFGNGLLFTKVVFSNEIYALCKKMGINYDEVRFLTSLDPRIGGGHTQVPGPDGFLGAGGHCFPKDMHNLKFLAESVGLNEDLFSAVLQRNGELREEKDWEKMNDRAVTDK